MENYPLNESASHEPAHQHEVAREPIWKLADKLYRQSEMIEVADERVAYGDNQIAIIDHALIASSEDANIMNVWLKTGDSLAEYEVDLSENAVSRILQPEETVAVEADGDDEALKIWALLKKVAHKY